MVKDKTKTKDQRIKELAKLRKQITKPGKSGTERKRADEQVLKQSAVLEAINKVLRETLICETDQEVARTCLAVSEELTGSKFGFIGEVNKEGRFDTIAMSYPGWDVCRIPDSDRIIMINDMEIRGFWGGVIKEEQSLIVNDPPSHPSRVGIPKGHPPITCFLGVPLKRAGRTIGMIALANKELGYRLTDQEAVEALSAAFVEALYRKRTEKALQESKNKYWALMEQAPVGIFLGDEKGNIYEVNDKACEITGYTRDELIRLKDRDLAPPGGRSFKPSEIKELLSRKESIREGLLYRKDGTTIEVEVRAKMIRSDRSQTIFSKLVNDITDRKRTEKALHESEERLRKIVENAKEMVVLHDLEGRILYYNGPVQYGLKPEDVVGKTIFDLIDQEKAADIMEQIMQVVEKDEALNFTDNISWKDKTFWVNYHRYPMKDKDGRIVAVGTIAHDITELKEAEKALEESEERFRSVVQTATEAIITIDCNGNITFWNHGAENMYGYRSDEIVGKSFTLIIPERIRKMNEIKHRNLVASTEELQRVIRTTGTIGLRKDGREFPTELSFSRWKTRKEVFLTAIVRDITERRQVEEALHVSNERLRCLIQNAAIVIVCLSPDHRVIEFNPEAERVFGCDWQEVIGKDYFELFLPEEVRGTIAENIKKVLTGEPIRGFEYPVLTTDGRKRILSWNINRLTDTMDKPTGVIAIGQDVTCRKRAEDKISHLNHLYTILTKVNETIVRVRQPEKLYEESCRIAVEDGLFIMAWVGLVDPDTGAIRPVAQRGFVGGYLDKIMASIGTDAPDGLDPVGTAIREGRYAVCDDFNTDPSMLPWREEGLKRGYRSAAAFPLRCGPHIVGSINFYAEGPHSFDNDVIGLLETLSNDISFALECFESERKREKTEQLMRESEERFRLIVENANDAIIMHNNRGEIVAWNRAAEDIFGYSAEETIGKPIAIIIPEQVHEGHQKAITITSMAVDENLHTFKKVKEMVGVRKDGGVITLEGSFSAWKAESDVFFTCILRDCSQISVTRADRLSKSV